MVKNLSKTGKIGLAALALGAVFVALGGLYLLMSPAQGAVATARKVTLSDPRPAIATNITIDFTLQNAWNAGDTLTVDLNDNYTITGFATTDALDYDISVGGADHNLVNTTGGCTAAADEIQISAIDGVNKTFTFLRCAGDANIASASVMKIEIGTNATFGGTGDTQASNPSKVAALGTADIYIFRLGGTSTTTGDMLVAVIEGVSVTVTVAESITFSIGLVASGSCTEGGAATAVSTTATAVQFSTITNPNTFYKGCHDLTVSTNAVSGYAITAEEDTSLNRTGTGDLIIDDTGCDSGPCTEVIAAGTTVAWGTNTNNGLGYTCSGTACNSAFTSATEFNQFACRGADANCDPGTGVEAIQTPISSGVAVSAQVSRIVYKLSVSGIQPAGTYDNTVTYIATPTF